MKGRLEKYKKGRSRVRGVVRTEDGRRRSFGRAALTPGAILVAGDLVEVTLDSRGRKILTVIWIDEEELREREEAEKRAREAAAARPKPEVLPEPEPVLVQIDALEAEQEEREEGKRPGEIQVEALLMLLSGEGSLSRERFLAFLAEHGLEGPGPEEPLERFLAKYYGGILICGSGDEGEIVPSAFLTHPLSDECRASIEAGMEVLLQRQKYLEPKDLEAILKERGLPPCRHYAADLGGFLTRCFYGDYAVLQNVRIDDTVRSAVIVRAEHRKAVGNGRYRTRKQEAAPAQKPARTAPVREMPEELKKGIRERIEAAIRERGYLHGGSLQDVVRAAGAGSYKEYAPGVEKFITGYFAGDFTYVKNFEANGKMIGGAVVGKEPAAQRTEVPAQAPVEKPAEVSTDTSTEISAEISTEISTEERIRLAYREGGPEAVLREPVLKGLTPSDLSEKSLGFLALSALRKAAGSGNGGAGHALERGENTGGDAKAG